MVTLTKQKLKLNSLRYFLAQTEGDGLQIRKKLMRLRQLRSKYATELYLDPFLCECGHLYVLNRILEWAELVFPANWENYATTEGCVELAKALRKEKYTPVTEVNETYLLLCFNEARMNYYERGLD